MIMKLIAIIDGAEHEIDVSRTGENVEILIDGESHVFDVSEPEQGIFVFRTDEGDVFEAFVDGDDTEGLRRVSVANEEYDVGIFDPRRMRGSGAGAGSEDGTVEIKTAMPGKVVRLLAREGDRIKAGDGVLVVEAMKMQNELTSPKDGTVREIRVKGDDRVNSGDVLAVIE